MNLRSYRTFQALLLALLAIYLLARIGDGRILLYINRRYVFLALGAAVLLMVVAQAVMRSRKEQIVLPHPSAPGPSGAPRVSTVAVEGEKSQSRVFQGSTHPEIHDFASFPALEGGDKGVGGSPPSPLHSLREGGEELEHEHGSGGRKGWVLWLMALPLLIGILIPARPLNTAAAAQRGLNTSAALTSQGAEAALSLLVPPQQRSVLDWIRVFSTAKNPAEFVGLPADVTGFVYHDVRLRQGEFMAGRFSVTCCVADAIAIGNLVQWPAAGSLPDNRWVRVRGSMDVGVVDGQKVPLIHASSVETIPEPEQPYIFP